MKLNEQKDQTIEKLKGMIEKFHQEKLNYAEDMDKLAKLYEMGIIDSKGDSIPFQPDLRMIWNKFKILLKNCKMILVLIISCLLLEIYSYKNNFTYYAYFSAFFLH